MKTPLSQPTPHPPLFPLPSPDERPNAAVVVFDGNCRFCWAQVSRLARWDTQQRLAFLSLHHPTVSERWPQLTREMLMRHMYVVPPDGAPLRGAAGLRYIASQLPRLWWLRLPLNVPGTMWFWQWLYDRVAKRRYWLAGQHPRCDDGSCQLPGS